MLPALNCSSVQTISCAWDGYVRPLAANRGSVTPQDAPQMTGISDDPVH
jgi:hypothetical protein